MRWMKMLFYFGIMIAFIAVGLKFLSDDFRSVSAVLLCISLFPIAIGLTGIVLNNYIKRVNAKRESYKNRR